MNTAETKKCERGCTCHLNEGANVFDAATDLANEFFLLMKNLIGNSRAKTGSIAKFIQSLEDQEQFFIDFAHAHYNTKDGKDDDIKKMAKLCHYIIMEHVSRQDIETIDHVKTKIYRNGDFGWTSVHKP